MRARRKFTPSLQSSALETRIVLSGFHGPNRIGAAVLLERLHAPARPFRRAAPASVSSLVDLSYQSFQQDYAAVRATYLAALSNGTATAADQSAFTDYTTQRVRLLSQEVTNSFLLYATSTTRGGKGSDNALPLIIRAINGAGDGRDAAPRQQAGSLVKNLIDSTPAPGSSTTTVALATITQDNAIEASRVATLNGVTIVRNGSFGSRSRH